MILIIRRCSTGSFINIVVEVQFVARFETGNRHNESKNIQSTMTCTWRHICDHSRTQRNPFITGQVGKVRIKDNLRFQSCGCQVVCYRIKNEIEFGLRNSTADRIFGMKMRWRILCRNVNDVIIEKVNSVAAFVGSGRKPCDRQPPKRIEARTTAARCVQQKPQPPL